MKREELYRKLNEIGPNEREKLNEFAANLETQARSDLQEIVNIWMGTDAGMSWKAAYVVARLQDLAIVPLLDCGDPNSALNQVWRIRQIVSWQLEIRKEIIALLERMLDDKTVVPYPESQGPIEEVPPEHRVCDVAYVHMRQLINFGESADEHQLNVSVYYQMEFEERDREIMKYRESKTWTDLLEEAEPFLDSEEGW